MKKFLAILALAAAPAFAGETPSPEGAQVYIISPKDGDTISGPVTVAFGAVGIGVAPAGVEWDNTGHHHLFLNRAPFDAAADGVEPIPADDNHKHFGGGQTQVTLELPPGTHTLQLVMGDAFHVAHEPPVVSDVITITVE
ncbi:DUF4399 domain-containing protein [Pseudoruegeria sp. SHC-113]|uniref:DUF4399 domain-containing protein n=1 Tax=Pseudoruegeria sp. SHC-113 TaxID=2855439 RepID=UPI0021BA7523|nr:DUF4399 domain-containing protein [Pseudoruegeria sp. SHC-113]MCT8161212.1 DUF4399 domain-containing protein [Pseudoruegeria sp. SHC-113]